MKFFLEPIGCRLNQSEVEKIASQLRAAGHTLVSHAGEADLVIINSCSVTAKAASDSRASIRRAYRSGAGKIIVTGCWSTLEPDIASTLPGVFLVVPNDHKDNLVESIPGVSLNEIKDFPTTRQVLPNHPRTRGFIKVQDGCDNFCTYCITRIARGYSRSRPVIDILNDIQAALDSDTKEIVLTGVNLGSWGRDFENPLIFKKLVETILERTTVKRLRFSSLEPWDLDKSFFSLWQDERICRHLHLPLQSGSATSLKHMARKITPKDFASLVETVRTVSPDIAVTSDIMVGFPGEGENEFQESLDFVKDMQFAAGHVFNFSARPGTPAASYPNQVSLTNRKERSVRMRDILAESSKKYQEKFIGRTLDVLWEASGSLTSQGWKLQGLSDNYLRVNAIFPRRLWNQIDQVLINSLTPSGLQGVIRI